ncbi:hypothetical protein SEA_STARPLATINUM_57 [Streptomyces phage StarPlatinum]|jgi:hypothetical protein|uniref:Tail terminator n=1 Tax=Streptomyces phage StarPlatinum TaxID=2283265 RepID=A0A345M8I4_9CAUD|nr:hypothetical protein HWB77_gp232 [Streptomyces phage StarPlatinum]AXH66805.1 hypothetical protein SEA_STARPLATINUM_57 [Streptomyces phage StarPlatinum]
MTYDITATHALNKFLIDQLSGEGFIDLTKYNGLSPFIPAQQQPELTNLPSGVPFFVYNYASNGEYEDWWLEHEQAAYIVYSDNEKQIRQITNYLNQLLKRYDWAADDINDYLREFGTTEQKKFEFKYTRVISMASIEPATDQGGRYSGSIIVNLCFTSQLNQEGMRV